MKDEEFRSKKKRKTIVHIKLSISQVNKMSWKSLQELENDATTLKLNNITKKNSTKHERKNPQKSNKKSSFL